MGCHPARVRVSWLNLLSLQLALFGLAAVSWIEPHFVLYSNDAPMRFLYFRAVVTITGDWGASLLPMPGKTETRDFRTRPSARSR
jgi:hypothetical protein